MAFIRKRGKGRWEISVHVGGGNRRWKTVHGTRRQAEREAALLEREVETGTALEAQKTTVEEYLHHWLESHVRLRNEPRTHQDYEYYVRRFLIPKIGRIKLGQLRPLDRK